MIYERRKQYGRYSVKLAYNNLLYIYIHIICSEQNKQEKEELILLADPEEWCASKGCCICMENITKPYPIQLGELLIEEKSLLTLAIFHVTIYLYSLGLFGPLLVMIGGGSNRFHSLDLGGKEHLLQHIGMLPINLKKPRIVICFTVPCSIYGSYGWHQKIFNGNAEKRKQGIGSELVRLISYYIMDNLSKKLSRFIVESVVNERQKGK